MTPTAEDFLAMLRARIDLFEHKLDGASDAYSRGLYAGWRTATEQALRDAEDRLVDVERQARMVPEPEEDFGSLRERLMAEEMA